MRPALARAGRKGPALPLYARRTGRGGKGEAGVVAAAADQGAADEGAPESDSKAVVMGRLMLVATAASYGSLTVALRYVFLSDGPPLPSVASFVRSILVALCFVPVLLRGTAIQRAPGERTTPPAFWRAALELSVWNFMSQGLQNAGCAFTDAGRASFLTQTAIVITPLIAALRGDAMPPLTLPAVVAAFAGVMLLACGGGDAGGLSLSLNIGDILCLAGSVCYSFYIVRTADYGRQALQMTGIQAYKSLWLMLLYFGWALVAYLNLPAGAGLIALWPSVAIATGWFALAYSAVLPGAGADVLQAIGQSRVNATEAQVLLSLEPLFAAVLGITLLGETMTGLACAGAALIILSVLLASGALDGMFTRQAKTAVDAP